MKNTKMTMKVSALAAMAILVAVAFVGLPTTADDVTTECHKGSSYETTLVAGQTIDVGTVLVWNDADSIHVEYEITKAGWYITDTHVAIAVPEKDENGDCECPDGIPQTNNGNPKIGKFAFSNDVDFIYDIAFDDSGIVNGPFTMGDCLCIATHAVVEERDGTTVISSQTGWGEGPEFDGNSWAMYFCWQPKYPTIPSGSIGYKIYNPGTENSCYWDTMITSGASGNVPDNEWLYGWCVETGQTIGEGAHTGTMTIPTGENWNKVNWILNHKQNPNDSPYNYRWQAIQAAIWYYTVLVWDAVSHSYIPLAPEKAGSVSGMTGWISHDITDAWELINAADGDYHGGLIWAVLITCSTANQQEIIVEIDP